MSRQWTERASTPGSLQDRRYRKEATGGLEDLQLETLFKRREYFLELTERRAAILYCGLKRA